MSADCLTTVLATPAAPCAALPRAMRLDHSTKEITMSDWFNDCRVGIGAGGPAPLFTAFAAVSVVSLLEVTR
jgi:hypothetical protein